MNAPPVFQRYMNECLVGFRDLLCTPYLDDILIYSKTFDEHINDFRAVLRRLKEHGIKLNAAKCDIFKRETKYLGNVSEQGYSVDTASNETIDRLKVPPKTVGDLRKLLGFIGYYRSYIQDFSRMAKPLYDFICKDKDKSKVLAVNQGKQKVKGNKNVDHLREYLKKPPIMACPDFSLPFVLHCDASEDGLGVATMSKSALASTKKLLTLKLPIPYIYGRAQPTVASHPVYIRDWV